jgi:ammonia channel protein AmtB
MLWKIAAAGSLLTAIWLFFTSSTSNHAAGRLAAMVSSGMFGPEEMTDNLHNLMTRESMRPPYSSADSQYVAWVVQQIRTKNQGKKIVAVALCGLAWYLFNRA